MIPARLSAVSSKRHHHSDFSNVSDGRPISDLDRSLLRVVGDGQHRRHRVQHLEHHVLGGPSDGDRLARPELALIDCTTGGIESGIASIRDGAGVDFEEDYG